MEFQHQCIYESMFSLGTVSNIGIISFISIACDTLQVVVTFRTHADDDEKNVILLDLFVV